ncbi:MAG: N-acetylmuramoyl-L-alanine amidase [Paludibacteraceae bacterium]|nr:N-acetylmuramoyl-L-alanine amidase [Paludibacteraceae bacterium]
MKYYRHLLIIFCLIGLANAPIEAATSIHAVEDSLNQYFSYPPCVPKIHVKNIRVKGSYVTIYSNYILSCVSFSPAELTQLRKNVSRWVFGHEKGKVTIYSDQQELGSLITARYKTVKNPYLTSRIPFGNNGSFISNDNKGFTVNKGLQGKHLTVWPSHGLYYNLIQDQWRWQRATMWSMVEDVYTPQLVNQWLVPMLENAGAYVFEPRERDTQTQEIILDRTDSTKVTADGAERRFTPTLTQEGEYGIYIRYHKPTDTKAHKINITHGGITTRYTYHPQQLDSTWQWLGKAYFTTDSSTNYILADSCIDAIRLGGGYGSVERYGQTSGMPRWTEAARYWLEFAGYPDSVWNVNRDSNDYRDDLQSRGYWVNHINEQVPIDFSLAVHTDGYSVPVDSAIIGTLALYTNRPNRDITDFIQTQVVEDIRRQWDLTWTRRELRDAHYAETNYPVVPAVLLEVLSHKNFADIRYALNPKFQFTVSRAIYKGILRGLNIGKAVVVQPLPVQRFKVEKKGEQFALSWQPTPDELEPTATPSFYLVYTRKDGGSWDNGTVVKTNSYTFKAQRGISYDFRVVAGNEGGISLPSETLSAYLAPQEEEQGLICIINAYHEVRGPQWFADTTYAGIKPRSYAIPYGKGQCYIGDQFIYDRSLDWVDDDNCGLGMCHQDYRGQLLHGNTFDYPALHGQVLKQLGYSYVSGDVHAYDFIDTIYEAIDVICGKQDTCNFNIDLIQHAPVPVLISGAHLGALHFPIRAANTAVHGSVKTLNTPIHYQTQPNAERLFAETCDALQATEGTVVLGRFSENGLPAIVLHPSFSDSGLTANGGLTAQRSYSKNGSGSTGGLLIYAFPLESAMDFESVYKQGLKWLFSIKQDNE